MTMPDTPETVAEQHSTQAPRRQPLMPEDKARLIERIGPNIAATAVFGFIWLIADLKSAWWFSVGFIVASVCIAYEIGSRKEARARAATLTNEVDNEQ